MFDKRKSANGGRVSGRKGSALLWGLTDGCVCLDVFKEDAERLQQLHHHRRARLLVQHLDKVRVDVFLKEEAAVAH